MSKYAISRIVRFPFISSEAFPELLYRIHISDSGTFPLSTQTDSFINVWGNNEFPS